MEGSIPRELHRLRSDARLRNLLSDGNLFVRNPRSMGNWDDEHGPESSFVNTITSSDEMARMTRRPAEALDDTHTVSYFDAKTPCYYQGFYSHMVSLLNTLAKEEDSLVDIGCGTGQTLQLISGQTRIRNLFGIDPSLNSLVEARNKGDFTLIPGSILDDALVASFGPRFRFAVLAFVLHHLIGRTRVESWRRAQAALTNATCLLQQGGYLFVVEEIVHPSFVAGYAFYLKKLFSHISAERIDPLKTDFSLGAPVVSYLTTYQLRRMVSGTLGLRVVNMHAQEKALRRVYRLAGINRIATVTLVAQKTL